VIILVYMFIVCIWTRCKLRYFNLISRRYIFTKLVIEQYWCPCVSVCLNVSVCPYIDNKVDSRKHKVWYFYKLYRSNKTVHKVHLIDFLPPAFIIHSLCQPFPFSSAILFSFTKKFRIGVKETLVKSRGVYSIFI
jgi:hypothetical protein